MRAPDLSSPSVIASRRAERFALTCEDACRAAATHAAKPPGCCCGASDFMPGRCFEALAGGELDGVRPLASGFAESWLLPIAQGLLQAFAGSADTDMLPDLHAHVGRQSLD